MTNHNKQYRPDSHRLPHWNYAGKGFYFITIITEGREMFFGTIANSQMQYSLMGKIVYNEFIKSFSIRKELVLDEFVIMPNHLHAIIILTADEDNSIPNPKYDKLFFPEENFENTPRLFKRKPRSISSFVAGYKSATVREIDNYIDSLKKEEKPDQDCKAERPCGSTTRKKGPCGSTTRKKGPCGSTTRKKGPCGSTTTEKGPCDSMTIKKGPYDLTTINKRRHSSTIIKKETYGSKIIEDRSTNIEDNSTIQEGNSIMRIIDNTELKSPPQKFNKQNPLWQANYHDHIIRNKQEYYRIKNYIRNNPRKWEEDRFRSGETGETRE